MIAPAVKAMTANNLSNDVREPDVAVRVIITGFR